MKKIIRLTAFITVLAVSFLSLNTAGAVKERTEAEVQNSHSGETVATVEVPQQAVENAPSIVPLGSAVDPSTGTIVEGIAIIHYKNENAKSSNPVRPGGPRGNACYTYLAKEAKWKTQEPWLVNTTNTAGLDAETVYAILDGAINEWEDAADGAVNGISGANILGNGSTTTSVLIADNASPDGQNEIMFGSIDANGVIAVTIVWGIFSGPLSGRELVEMDQVYDQEDFSWSTNGQAGSMDFENIAQHELGHGVGMGHPDDSCTSETMYRYAATGETVKRDLNTGDIAGINGLY